MRYLVSIAWTLLIITVAVGCNGCKRSKPPKVLTQEYVNEHIFGDDYVSRAVRINPGSAVPIYTSPSSLELMKDMDWDESEGSIKGIFCDGSHPDRPVQMRIVGEWSSECETILHEYQHYIEHCVPDRKKELRAAFRAIDCDTLRIGNADLMEEIP